MKDLFRSILRLGAGEAVARLASFGLFAYLSRSFGIELVGILALSQTIASYVTLGTDQGLRMIGARLVARDASAAPTIIRVVFQKRLISCSVCLAIAILYAWKGPVPANARLYVVGFALGVIPYAFSLDCLAWGLGHLGWLGAWRAGVSLLFLLIAVIAIRMSATTLLPITIANAVSAALGAVLLWALWRWRWRSRSPRAGTPIEKNEIINQLGWAAVLPLGASTIMNLMFNNFDTVMLAGMTTAKEVGRYSAAYKILFVVFGTFYLATQSLYPKLSRLKGGRRTRKLLFISLAALAAFGVCMSVAIAASASLILRVIYGADFGAVHLLRVLSLAVPMEFCVALLGTVLVSRGFHNLVLACTGSAAAFNIASNWLLIPRMGAEGAAWSTVTSYLFLLILALAFFATKPVLQEEPAGRVGSECAA